MKIPLYYVPQLFLLVVIYCSVCNAQPHDIRISPPDTSIYPFPESIVIQSADRAGSMTLVVWGGTAPDADTGVRPVLWGQIVQGNARRGEPMILTDSKARPAGVASVLAVADRFLVLWNDMRVGGSGVYMQRVGLDGKNVGAEIRFPAPNPLQSDAHLWLLRDSLGYSVIWSDSVAGDQPAYFHQRLDDSGLPQGGRRLVPSPNFDEERRYAGLPGVMILSGDRPLFHHANGEIDERPIPTDRLQQPYYLAHDTSLAMLGHDEQGGIYFEYYKTIFDTVPVYRTPVPSLPGRVPSASAVARDSSGAYRILFLRELEYQLEPPIYKTIDLFSVTLRADGSFTPPSHIALIASGPVYTGNSATYTTLFSDFRSDNGDDNSHRITFRSAFRIIGNASGFGSDTTIHKTNTLLLDRYGNISLMDSVQKEIQRGDIRSPLYLLRATAIDSSIVRIVISPDTVALGVSLASLSRNYEQTDPALALRDGVIVALWRQPESRPRFHQARLFSHPDSVLIHLVPFIPDEIYPYKSERSYYENNAGLIPLGGNTIVRSTSHSGMQFKPMQWGRAFYSRTYFPTDSGWNRSAIGSDIVQWNTPLVDDRYGYDPNTGITIGCFTSREYGPGKRRIMLFGPGGGSLLDTMHVHPSIGSLVITGERDYLNIHNNVAVNSTGSFLFSLDSSSATVHARYQRALGGYFLRYYPVDPLGPEGRMTSPSVQFEQYDLSGNRTGSIRIDASGKYFDPVVLQRPVDSSLYVIWPSDSGLWLNVITPGCNASLPPRRISATTGKVSGAAALFRNDSLFAIWEDYRNGAADIYGTVCLPGATAELLRSPDPDEVRRSCIYPLPASGQVNIPVNPSLAGMLRLIVSNATGRVVSDEMVSDGSAGDGMIAVNVEELSPGTYFFSLIGTDGSRTGGRFVVRR